MIETTPVWLAALVLASVLFSFLTAYMFRRRRRLAPFELSAAILLVLAAVGASVPSSASRTAVLLVDVSFSTGTAVPDLAALADRAGVTPNGARILLFGERWVGLGRAEGSWPKVKESDVERAGRGGSDLASALREAARRVTAGDRVVIFTDGRVDARAAGAAAVAVLGAGVSIQVLSTGRRMPGDGRVLSLDVPSRAPAGSSVSAVVGVAGAPGSSLEVRVLVDGDEVASRRVGLGSAGHARARFSISDPGSGYHEVLARIEPPAEDPTDRNDWLATGVVVGGRRHALIVGGGALTHSFSSMGYDVESVEDLPETSLLEYDLLVVADTPATSLPDGGRSLSEYVAAGGGLLLLGGERAFAPGGYSGRPIEDCLPLRSEPGQRRLRVLVLLDRSGSMAEPFGGGGPTKIDAARAGVRRLIDVLPPSSSFELVSFAGAARASPPISLADAAGKRKAADEVDAVPAPRGSTSLLAPLSAALRVVRGAGRAKTLVILFTDGRAEGESSDRILSLARSLRAAGARLGVLGVGAKANMVLLERLSDPTIPAERVGGGGQIEHALLADLLRFEGEGKVLVGERAVVPGPGADSPFSGPLPPVEGLVTTWIRPGADLWMQTNDGHPLVAGWRYGLGRAIAVATNPFSVWARSWVGTGLLSRLARRVVRPKSLAGVRVSIRRREGKLSIAVVPPSPSAGGRGALTRSDGDKRTFSLDPVGAGELRAVVPSLPAGACRVTIRGAGLAFDGGAGVPYPSEYRATGPDPAALSRLERAVAVGSPSRGARRDVRALLGILALGLFLLSRLFARTRTIKLPQARDR